MQKFKYRLESLLDLRKHYEREWEIRLAELTGACITLQRRIEELTREKQELSSGPSTPGPLDMGNAAAVQYYRDRLETALLGLMGDLAEKEAERQKVQESYLEASREKKVLEKLKERKAEEYYRERLKNEAKVLDDIAGATPARRKIQGQ